jgi:hypothetical protein
MRPFVLALAVFAASANPAPAQVDPLRSLKEGELLSQQQTLRERNIALENQLFNLETRLDTQQRMRELDRQQARHAPVSQIPSDPGAARRSPDLGGYASIPDDRLAASNARVREASRNRR